MGDEPVLSYFSLREEASRNAPLRDAHPVAQGYFYAHIKSGRPSGVPPRIPRRRAVRSQSVKDSTLRLSVFGAEPCAEPARNGFAQVSNEILGRADLSSNAKVVYGVVVNDCRAGDRTYASVDEVASWCSLARRVAQIALAELKAAGVIDRYRDPTKPMCPWATVVLVDKRGTGTRPKSVAESTVDTRTESRSPLRVVAQPIARSR